MIIHELFINKNTCNTQELFLGDVPRIFVIKISNQRLFIHSWTTNIVITIKVVNTQPPKLTKPRVVQTQLLSSSFRHDQKKKKKMKQKRRRKKHDLMKVVQTQLLSSSFKHKEEVVKTQTSIIVIQTWLNESCSNTTSIIVIQAWLNESYLNTTSITVIQTWLNESCSNTTSITVIQT